MFSSNTSQVSEDANYIEQVFATHLYTGNGSTQTINNGIDLAGKGGLVWTKVRSTTYSHFLADTIRGAGSVLSTNNTNAADTGGNLYSGFNTNGYGVTTSYGSGTNGNGATFASWTFRKQPKFFDVVTFSTTSSSSVPITVNHNLGSVPGCIIVKQTNGAADWFVYHRSLGSSQYLALNSTDFAQNGGTSKWAATPTATAFTLGGDFVQNATYVAYLFAHDAGGFGLTGTDNVISCGSYTGNGATPGTSVTLGWEPQWIMVKRSSAAEDWMIVDNMRGMPVYSGQNQGLYPNKTDEETAQLWGFSPTATGFQLNGTNTRFNAAGSTYIYIAIRRGPMKTPTSGTSVFSPVTRAGTSADATVSAGFPPDSLLVKNRGGSASSVDWSFNFFDKLRSPGYRLSTAFTNAEDTSVNFITSFDQNGVTLPATGYTATNGSGYNYINYFLRRAPGFFDEVCYTGTGSSRTITHNLAAVPQLMLVKQRTASPVGTPFAVYSATMGNTGIMFLNSDGGNQGPDTQWNSTTPTASVFSVGSSLEVNQSGSTYVAYLFASCPGVSKVGSYTGNGSTQTINCGFTGGARFVMIKRTDSTGDWYVWDTARGIVSANDPRLSLNTTSAEVTTDDSIDPDNSGFIVNQVSATNINVSSATYIYLAIA